MIGIDDVRSAAAALDGVAHRTPVLSSRTLDAATGATVFCKAECYQRGGAFKFRGAYSMISRVPSQERARASPRTRPATTPRRSRSRRRCSTRRR